jgi:hypothetical protein
VAYRRDDGWEIAIVPEAMQYALLISGWVAAFMLGKELQTGFAEWRRQRRSE